MTQTALADPRALTRRLVPAQALFVLGTSVDLTLTGIVGAHLAPTRALATLPFSLIPVVAASTTFALSRWIGRSGYRRVFTFAASVAVPAGLVSALAVQRRGFWLFCLGTALIGVYQAGAGYYRYAAAESNPSERARAVSTVLAGGLVAALIGPFLATAVGGFTATPYVLSYVLVACAGGAAAIWNATMPESLATLAAPAATPSDGAVRSRRVLWRQPSLLLGVGAVALAAVSMTSMMTAGPIAGMSMGHSEGEAAFSVQLHMVGMFAPGFVVARWIGRVGERRIAMIGALLLAVAGAAAAVSMASWAFLAAMFGVGVGWNLASSGGSAMVTAAYRPAERGRVQPIAELTSTTVQVIGALSAGALASGGGWQGLGVAVAALSIVVVVLAAARRPSAGLL
ncbi:MFS transporter [Cellulomonas sp. McL0617]|uniref:MFS transporter n=1 Tax=Cellulomonas sp. McL0617 TaxID=3415675 RepID=UPI003CE99044